MQTTKLPTMKINGKTMYLYWSYGSNLNQRQMMARCSDAIPLMRADLPSYHLLFRGNRRGNGVATVEPQIGSKIPGALWAVSQADLRALDRYEGYPTLYTRGNIKVHTEEGEVVEAMTYWMHDHYVLAEPSDYYLQTIREGYMDFGLDLGRFDLFCAKHDAACKGVTA